MRRGRCCSRPIEEVKALLWRVAVSASPLPAGPVLFQPGEGDGTYDHFTGPGAPGGWAPSARAWQSTGLASAICVRAAAHSWQRPAASESTRRRDEGSSST